MYVTSIIRASIKCEEIKLSCQKLFYRCDILKTKKLSICFIYPSGVFLALILCQFLHDHPYSVSYQRDRALFDSFKVLHQVVAVVTDTVLTLELASSLQIKVFLQSSRVSTMKWTYAPSGKCTQLSISSLQMTILPLNVFMLCYEDTVRWDLQIIVRDTHVTWCYDCCCTRSFKNHPLAGYISIYRSHHISKEWVRYFSRFLSVGPKYLCFNGAKNCQI